MVVVALLPFLLVVALPYIGGSGYHLSLVVAVAHATLESWCLPLPSLLEVGGGCHLMEVVPSSRLWW